MLDEIRDHLQGAHMCFVTAGMGGGTGTGAAPVVARCAKEAGILTVGVVTKPFHFEGVRRMRVAEAGIQELHKVVDTLLIIPNQNLFRVANEKTTFADAFAMADQVLYSGVACITDLMVKEGLINLDFADVRAVMREMGKAMMGTGEASGEKRALAAAEAAISNPLIDDASMKGARGLLISITGGKDLTLYEVDEAATRIREEVDQDANIIVGATFDETLEGIIRVSVVATGIEQAAMAAQRPVAAAPRPASPRSRKSCGPTDNVRAERYRAHRDRRVATPVANSAVPSINTEAIEQAAQSRGRGSGAADDRDRGCDDPADPAEAVAVPGAGPPVALDPPAPRTFIPPAPGAPVRPPVACPGSTNCRSRVRRNCAPSGARCAEAESPEKPRGGLLRRLAAVGLGRRESEPEMPRRMSGRCARCRVRPSGPAAATATSSGGLPSAGATGSGAGLRIRQAPAASGARSARPPSPCA